MTITVTTTSQTLETILGATGIESVNSARKLGKPFYIMLQNPDTSKKVFCEIGSAATTTGSVGILPNFGALILETESDLSQINLVSEVSSTDIRLLTA